LIIRVAFEDLHRNWTAFGTAKQTDDDLQFAALTITRVAKPGERTAALQING
jgi:hypothetical protein